MGIAVVFENWIFCVYSAMALSEPFPCRSDVGAVKEDDCVETGDGGMH